MSETTFRDFWNAYDVCQIFFVGVGCPAGETVVDCTCGDDDDCDLREALEQGLICTPADSNSPQPCTGYLDLIGTVAGKTWTWNGEGAPRDSLGNDYQKIQMLAR